MSDLDFNGLTDAQKRLFAVRCARRVQHLMKDPRSIAALDVAERYAKGLATDEELKEARDAAYAAWSVFSVTEWAASVAASAAASAASSSAVWAAKDASWDAAYAARVAEREEQVKILDEIRGMK